MHFHFLPRDSHAWLHYCHIGWLLLVSSDRMSRLNWQNQFPTLHPPPLRPQPASSDVTTDFFSFCIFTKLSLHLMSCFVAARKILILFLLPTKASWFSRQMLIVSDRGRVLPRNLQSALILYLYLHSVCTQWTPAQPQPAPAETRGRGEREKRRRESGAGQWPIGGQYPGRRTNQSAAGEVREASSGPGCAGVVLATASGARKQPQVSPVECPSSARRGDPPHNHTPSSWTQSFFSPWQQPSLSSASSTQVSRHLISSCHRVFWLQELRTHNQVWTVPRSGHQWGWGAGVGATITCQSLPWTTNN